MKGFKIICLICMEESNFDDIEGGSGMGDKHGIELAAMCPWKAEDYEARVECKKCGQEYTSLRGITEEGEY